MLLTIEIFVFIDLERQRVLANKYFPNNARISVLFKGNGKLLRKSFQNATTELDRERREVVFIDPNRESLIITITMKIEFDNLPWLSRQNLLCINARSEENNGSFRTDFLDGRLVKNVNSNLI